MRRIIKMIVQICTRKSCNDKKKMIVLKYSWNYNIRLVKEKKIMDKMLVLQICQFILSLIEVGMCYRFYDQLINKECHYKRGEIIKLGVVICAGSFLYYNRLTTCFMSNVLYILKSIAMAVPMCFLYKEKYTTSLSITLSYFSMVGLVHIVCMLLVIMIVKDEMFINEVYRETGTWRIIILIITTLVVCLIYRILSRWKKTIIILVKDIKRSLLIIGFFGCWTIAWGQIQILELGSKWAIWSLGTLLFTLGSIAGICYMLYITMKKDVELSTIQMKSQLLNSYYDDIRTITEKCLYTTHDMKNHILVLKSFAEKKNIEKIQDYLDKIGDPISKMNQYIGCENDIVNLIINTKLGYASKKGIFVKTDIENIDYPMTDNELCSLFANLLDNAVEACEKVADNKRWIKINISDKNGCFIIKIANSISGVPKKDKKSFISNKSGHMGYGLKSVAAIVDKYNGIMKCDFDEFAFSVIITFWKGR